MHRLWIPGLLPPGLNGSSGLMREHHRDAKRRKARMSALLLAHCRPFPQIRVRVNVLYTRLYWHPQGAMDCTNAAASFKHLEDAIVSAGILVDDSPEYVARLSVQQIRTTRGRHGSCVDFYLAEPYEQQRDTEHPVPAEQG